MKWDLISSQEVVLQMHWHNLCLKVETCLIRHLLIVLWLGIGVLFRLGRLWRSRLLWFRHRFGWCSGHCCNRGLVRNLYGLGHFNLNYMVFVVAFVSHRRLVISTSPLAIHHKFELVVASGQLVRSLQQELELVGWHTLHRHLLPIGEGASDADIIATASPLEQILAWWLILHLLGLQGRMWWSLFLGLASCWVNVLAACIWRSGYSWDLAVPAFWLYLLLWVENTVVDGSLRPRLKIRLLL